MPRSFDPQRRDGAGEERPAADVDTQSAEKSLSLDPSNAYQLYWNDAEAASGSPAPESELANAYLRYWECSEHF